MTVPDTSESTQTDGEGPDGSDKPPHDDIPPTTSHSSNATLAQTNTKLTPRPTISPMTANGVKPSSSIPLPPPDADAYPKQPGRTRKSLERLAIKQEPTTTTTTTGSKTPSSSTSSPAASDCESWSAPSTRPPSEVPSRHPSVSGGPSGNKLVAPSKTAVPVPGPVAAAPAPTPRPPAPVTVHATPEPAPAPAPAPSIRSKPASVHSDDGRHKFTLKDLLASGPKLARKSSNRSTGSSRKSNSDGGGGKSIAGDSAASLATKYGVCQKVAIGKGATSVVRLAHKWDRSEEKLYAVKVRPRLSLHRTWSDIDNRSSERDERMNQKKNTSRN